MNTYYDWVDRAAAEWNRLYASDSSPEQRLLNAQRIKNVVVRFGPCPEQLTEREKVLRSELAELRGLLEDAAPFVPFSLDEKSLKVRIARLATPAAGGKEGGHEL